MKTPKIDPALIADHRPNQYDDLGSCRTCGAAEGGPLHAPWCEYPSGETAIPPSVITQYHEARMGFDNSVTRDELVSAWDALTAAEGTLIFLLHSAMERYVGPLKTYGRIKGGFWAEFEAGDIVTFRTTDDGRLIRVSHNEPTRRRLTVIQGGRQS